MEEIVVEITTPTGYVMYANFFSENAATTFMKYIQHSKTYKKLFGVDMFSDSKGVFYTPEHILKMKRLDKKEAF